MRLSTSCLKTALLQAGLLLAMLNANLRQRMQCRHRMWLQPAILRAKVSQRIKTTRDQRKQCRHRMRLQPAMLRAKVSQRIKTTRDQIALHSSRCRAALHIAGASCLYSTANIAMYTSNCRRPVWDGHAGGYDLMTLSNSQPNRKLSACKPRRSVIHLACDHSVPRSARMRRQA